MTGSTEHRLTGLEPDNLLAFLALLGLLRALGKNRPDWYPRARWDVENPPTRPVLVLREPATARAVADAAAAGCEALAKDYEFGEWKVPNGGRVEGRALLRTCVEAGPTRRDCADVLSALFSDIAVKEADGTVIPTPLCLLFGQGHQYFLERLSLVPRQACAPPRGRGKKAVTPTPTETLTEALFETWKRIDPSPSFRWDPEEDRRYALRFLDPSKDTALTVHGANRLAALGLPILTVAPATIRSRIRLLTIGVRQRSGVTEITWPIWTRAASLNGIRALLTHPLLQQNEPDKAKLRSIGIHEARRARRVSVGKFLNFTRAVAI
jgi:hypothetical protein